MPNIAPSMPTTGEIARRLGQPLHRVEYLIRTRCIQPAAWAGNSRVFCEEAVQLIARELQRQNSHARPTVARG